ncbi:putative oxalocrotonate tautomerase [Mycena galopus ATCC 62051]|nr:putative oxalocrotonate tautomerase [Mycena galopus ATCC 62051]
MPLHCVFVPKGAEDLAQAIADVYTKAPPNLLAFYVVVLFIDLDTTSYFVSGKTTERMVRISVGHLAQNFPQYSDAARKRGFIMDRYEAALVPFTKGRGMYWEVQITNCDVCTHPP